VSGGASSRPRGGIPGERGLISAVGGKTSLLDVGENGGERKMGSKLMGGREKIGLSEFGIEGRGSYFLTRNRLQEGKACGKKNARLLHLPDGYNKKNARTVL